MTIPDTVALDRSDPLASLREQFLLPEGKVYLDGNSLGALPKAAMARIEAVVRKEWGQDLISSWNSNDWINLPITVGEKIATLMGAAPGQVISCDNVSINLFKLIVTALQLQMGRKVILTQKDNFPTDLYMTEGVGALLGDQRCVTRSVPADQLVEAMDTDIALLLLTQVNFRDGRLHDIEAITRAAHANGILVLWDLAHSAGVVPLELDRWQVDMAVGCGYKFLNGGPGAPAFLYLATRHQDKVSQPLSGWLGHAEPFAFEPGYRPAPGVSRYLGGTPGILGMSALDAALDVFDGFTIDQIRGKSSAMTALFIDGVRSASECSECRVVTPLVPEERGSQVSLAHPRAYGIAQALIEAGVVVDFRAPDIVRFGFSPLYNSYRDVADALRQLLRILAAGEHLQARFDTRAKVT
ncbi:kynureninase [Kineobactrum sediminis]|uniref:Kynureninase n=1 Tax=Kineobactrum sediminis TaxID=1905677 RepID=A0A2N5Y5T6_9GAMM|nr:kynureninase [Kineobactrum sediminis]PLW83753.1 kynureninase [Kineobactrum sediminis]